jgi:hypothetical protein
MKIAFTSCMDAENAPSQPVWTAIQADQPDVLMLLGDQIYMDWGLSLAKEPQWKKLINKKGEEGLALFAQDMHRRYALQWQVPQFRAFVRWFTQRPGYTPQRLLVTWDEHDLAWNNAYGEGVNGEGEPLRTVPPAVKTVARRLFDQFVAMLRDPAAPDAYPPLNLPTPLMALVPPVKGVEQGPLDVGDVRLMLLDERWYRTHRDHPNEASRAPQLLGAAQQAWLFGALGQAGLTIVAGSSPMKHGYLLGHQGWHAPARNGQPARDYPEYQAFQNAAVASGKAVLYLAGDIHKNAWGGRIGTSPIVQAVSSGAGLGNVAFKRFAPCWGIVDLPAPGQVHLQLKRLDTVPPDPANPSIDKNIPLTYGPTGWTSPIPAGESEPIRFDGSTQLQRPMGLLCLRPRTAPWREREDELVFGTDDFETLYAEGPSTVQDESPDVVQLTPAPGGLRMTARRPKNDLQPMADLFHAAFERAAAAGNRPVVLFVHGFGKGFADSIGQAVTLADTYDAEVVPISWASGEGEGLLGLLGAVLQGQTEAEDIYTTGRLRNAVLAFGRVGLVFPAIRKVMVVRSLGSLPFVGGMSTYKTVSALQAQWGRPPHEVIDRLVLSSAAVPYNRHKKWLGGWGLPACVTVNRDDYKLRIYNWLEIGRVPLGMGALNAGDLAAGALYFDVTDLPGIGQDHDYLFRTPPGTPLHALNRALVRGEPLPDTLAGFDRHGAIYKARRN